MKKTEFFDIAARQGFYGVEKGGIYGKKDNVRKYWEDVSIKVNLRKYVTEILGRKNQLRTADLGSGSGEGFEALTHIPCEIYQSPDKEFVLTKNDIEFYLGVDISGEMVETGKKNYSGRKNVDFMQGDLARDYRFLDYGPFDLIFSTYSSPSHLSENELMNLLIKISETHPRKVVVVLDLFAMYSPEWPGNWNKKDPEMKEYNMVWLYLPQRTQPKKEEIYYVKYWGGNEMRMFCKKLEEKIKRKVEVSIRDRSVLIGRHIDTGAYNNIPKPVRKQVNKLFDRDYRGKYETLTFDISYLDNLKESAPDEYNRIAGYAGDWNTMIAYTKALFYRDDVSVKRYIETSPEYLSEEMKMLAWLVRNASRFPVVDFWASIYGPQLAAILRNLEFNLPEGLGCGHGMMCNITINEQ